MSSGRKPLCKRARAGSAAGAAALELPVKQSWEYREQDFRNNTQFTLVIRLITRQWSLPPLRGFLSPGVIPDGVCDFPSEVASGSGGGDRVSQAQRDSCCAAEAAGWGQQQTL